MNLCRGSKELARGLHAEGFFIFIDMEIWKDVVGFEGFYQASNTGDIKSTFYNKGKLNSKLKQTLRSNGYLFVVLYKEGKKHNRNIHRIISECFIPNPENKPQVNHKNGVKTDNRAENLEWSTASENIFHAHRIGLMNQSCDKNGNSKLTRDQVYDVRYGKIQGSNRKIAKLLGVSHSLIGFIRLGKIWKEI